MQFEFPEDQAFFEALLINDAEHLSIKDFEHLFDFRAPDVKRSEFNRIRNTVFETLVQRDGLRCLLNLEVCDPARGFVVDHLIPLSTNKLNKRLRALRPQKRKKAPAQSFGSNHIDNLILACTACNNHKKHRILDGAKMRSIGQLKKWN